MSNFFGCIPRMIGKLKPYAGWILTGAGTAGMIGTVALTIRETPKVHEGIEDLWTEKYLATGKAHPPEDGCYTDEWFEEHQDKLVPTGGEKFRIWMKHLWPAMILGVGTLGCFWGAQVFNAKKQAALVAAYGLLAAEFDQYREVIRAEHGEEADRRAMELSRKRIQYLQAEIKRLKDENGPYLYSLATLPGIVFEAKPADLFESFMHFNRTMLLRGYGTEHELYSFIGIPESCYNKINAKAYGWQEHENEVAYGSCYVDFQITEIPNQIGGRPVNLITTVIPPYEVEVDYGFEGDSSDRRDPGYNPELAEEYAKTITQPHEIVQIDHPEISYMVF